MPIDKKISELEPADALAILLSSELAIAPIGSPQTLKITLELIQSLIGGGEKTYMAATDPLLETGRESDNWLNTDVGSFWKKQGGVWVLKYSFAPGTGGGSNINQSFETLVYAASKTVAHNPLRPKKKITLAGNIDIVNNNTINGSHGIYLLVQDSTGSYTATINGAPVSINPAADSATVIGWMFDGTGYYFTSNYSSEYSFSFGIVNDKLNTFQLV